MSSQSYTAGQVLTFSNPDIQIPQLCAIPPGTFDMGDINKTGYANESPVVKGVKIDHWFGLGRCAVTMGEYHQFVDDMEARGKEITRPKFDECDYEIIKILVEDDPELLQWYEQLSNETKNWDRQQIPVAEIHHTDAQAYVQWINEKCGLDQDAPDRFRLPTEAEWEYACRAETQDDFTTGKHLTYEQANYATPDHLMGIGVAGRGRHHPVPVDYFEPNGWGLYQMLGNVWEWCEDHYEENAYEQYADHYPNAVKSDAFLKNVIRGGDYMSEPDEVRASSRSFGEPGLLSVTSKAGFRIARTLPCTT